MDGVALAAHLGGTLVCVGLLLGISGAYVCTFSLAFSSLSDRNQRVPALTEPVFRTLLAAGVSFGSVVAVMAWLPHNRAYNTLWMAFAVLLGAGLSAAVFTRHNRREEAEQAQARAAEVRLRADRAAERAARVAAKAFLASTPRAISRDVAGRLGYEAGARLAVVARLVEDGPPPVPAEPVAAAPVPVIPPARPIPAPADAPVPTVRRLVVVPPVSPPPMRQPVPTTPVVTASELRELMIERLVTVGPPAS